MFRIVTVTMLTPQFSRFKDVKTANFFRFNAVNSAFFPIQRQKCVFFQLSAINATIKPPKRR